MSYKETGNNTRRGSPPGGNDTHRRAPWWQYLAQRKPPGDYHDHNQRPSITSCDQWAERCILNAKCISQTMVTLRDNPEWKSMVIPSWYLNPLPQDPRSTFQPTEPKGYISLGGRLELLFISHRYHSYAVLSFCGMLHSSRLFTHVDLFLFVCLFESY